MGLSCDAAAPMAAQLSQERSEMLFRCLRLTCLREFPETRRVQGADNETTDDLGPPKQVTIND